MTQPYNPQYNQSVQQAPMQGYPQYNQPMQPLPVAPGYPPQQYGQVPPPAQPQAPLAQGTLDDFYDQPTVGGGSGLPFKILGTEHYVETTRPITKADVQQQTDTRGNAQTFRDGRPKFQMLVPVHVLNSNVPESIGSTATFYVKGATREKLAAAMAAAGAPAGPPEAGCRMRLRYAADVPTGAGFNPRKDIDITYDRPADAPATSVAPIAPAQIPQPSAAPAQLAPLQPMVNVPPAPAQATPAAPLAQDVRPPAAPIPAAGMPPAPPQMSPEQQAAYATLLAQIGQPQA